MDCLWTVYGLSLDCFWNVLDCSWNVLDCSWTVSELSLECPLTVSGLSLECLLTVSVLSLDLPAEHSKLFYFFGGWEGVVQ